MRPAEASLPHDHIALLKTQDMRYVTMKRALDVKVRGREGIVGARVWKGGGWQGREGKRASPDMGFSFLRPTHLTESGEAPSRPAFSHRGGGQQAHCLRGHGGASLPSSLPSAFLPSFPPTCSTSHPASSFFSRFANDIRSFGD